MKNWTDKTITINTDASFCSKTGVGGYAFWIKSDLFTLKEFGAFNQSCLNSTDAELKCIINAVARLVSNKDVNFSYVLVINTDSKGAISWMRNPKNEVAKIFQFYLKELNAKGYLKTVAYKHVKGHTNVNDSRSFVNRWCDEMAGQEMRKQRKIQEKIINKNK